MVDYHGNPVAEGPALRQAEREPRGPKTQLRGNQGKIDMPDVIRSFGRDHSGSQLGGNLLGRWRFFGSLGRCLLLRRLGVRRFFENAADGTGAQMEPGSAEDLRDLHFTEGRAEKLQPLYGINVRNPGTC